jgi:dipeptidyl aminopeptidase/acylaminoacyl peptidase
MKTKSAAASLPVIAICILFASYADAKAGFAKQRSLTIPVASEGPRRKPTSADLITLREIGGMGGTGLSISPDGRYLAFEAHQADIDANDYTVAWFVSKTIPGSAAINVGNAGDATLFRSSLASGRIVGAWIADYAKWSTDSRGIAYRKRTHGETQLWWSGRDGESTEQLTHSAADVDDFYWSRDGSQIYFTTDADREDLRQAEQSRYRNGHVFDDQKDWSTIKARPFYPPYSLIGSEARVWVLDIRSGEERLATANERGVFEQLKRRNVLLEQPQNVRHLTAWVDNGSPVAWVQADDPERQGRSPPLTLYASVAADDSDLVRCAAPECTGVLDLSGPLRDGLGWNAVEEEILFVRKEGMGYSKRALYGWRVGEDRARHILTTDEWISDCSIVRNRAVCFRETPSYPRTIVSVDLTNGAMQTIVDPNPEFRNLIIGDVDLFEWKNSHGYGTFGYLVKPPDYVPGRRYPLVFIGYRAKRALRGGVGNEYPVHLLAGNGFVVLVYDKPSTYEAQEVYTDPLDIARARWGPDLFDVRMPLASFESAIRILTEKGLIDPDRVAVTGLSSGAADVNYSLIHSNLFAAAIVSSSDFAPNGRVLSGAAGEFVAEYRRAIGAGLYPGEHGFLWPHMSLSLNVERIETPLLINCSDSEHPWALEEVVTLIENDKPVEMVVYPDEGHIKWQPAHRASIYERNIDWLNFWLRTVEDQSPSKINQYVRWRQLRNKHALEAKVRRVN